MTSAAGRIVVVSVCLALRPQSFCPSAIAAGPYTIVELPFTLSDPALNDHDQVAGMFSMESDGIHLLDLRDGTSQVTPCSPSLMFAYYVLLNNEGDILVAGSFGTSLWRDGTETPIEFMDCYGMNDACQVVGKDGLPVLWEDGVKTHFGTLGGDGGWADDINNSGMIAGATTLTSQGGGMHAFLYADGIMTDLGTLGGGTSDSYGINELGHVVGWSDVDDDMQRHGFYYAEGTMTDLGLLPGTGQSIALDLNDHGQVVGYCGDEFNIKDNPRAFLWEDGVMTDLNDLLPAGSGWNLTRALYVNNHGTILGMGYNTDDEYLPFAMMVVPEPTSFLLLLGGFALLRRRKR